VVLPKESRPIELGIPETMEPVEAVERQRESSGQAPIAGVGDVDGDGDSLRNDGCSRSSCVAAIFVDIRVSE
jgi:hypothetical protein